MCNSALYLQAEIANHFAKKYADIGFRHTPPAQASGGGFGTLFYYREGWGGGGIKSSNALVKVRCWNGVRIMIVPSPVAKEVQESSGVFSKMFSWEGNAEKRNLCDQGERIRNFIALREQALTPLDEKTVKSAEVIISDKFSGVGISAEAGKCTFDFIMADPEDQRTLALMAILGQDKIAPLLNCAGQVGTTVAPEGVDYPCSAEGVLKCGNHRRRLSSVSYQESGWACPRDKGVKAAYCDFAADRGYMIYRYLLEDNDDEEPIKDPYFAAQTSAFELTHSDGSKKTIRIYGRACPGTAAAVEDSELTAKEESGSLETCNSGVGYVEIDVATRRGSFRPVGVAKIRIRHGGKYLSIEAKN